MIDFSEYVYYDESSPTFLKWRKDIGCKIKKDTPAGSFDKSTGYFRVMFNKKHHRVNRVVWRLFNGEIQPGIMIDHKDLNKANNCIDNLRPATRSQNHANRLKTKANTSGYKGVSWSKNQCSWRSEISVSGKRILIGYYCNPSDAHTAYCREADKHLGEFANGG